jgi:hypothetical protein
MPGDTLMQQIKRRAYEIWIGEGCPHGRDHIHWLRAEAECREQLAAEHAAGICRGGLHEKPVETVSGMPSRQRKNRQAKTRNPNGTHPRPSSRVQTLLGLVAPEATAF